MVETAPPHLPAGVTLAEAAGGLTAVHVDTPAATGTVYLQGAHLTQWTPTGAQPIIWVSEHAVYAPGKSIRGGVPLCAPWFGPGLSKDLSPAHGWFRTAVWTLAKANDLGPEGIELTFTLDGADADIPAGMPTGIRATYTVTIGSKLTLALTITTDEDLIFEDALHTYLAVADVREVSVTGLDGTRYVDKAPGGRAVNAQSGALTLTRETDRVYAHDGSLTLTDPGLARTITITKSGSASTVVWNPWSTKAVGMSDFGDDEWSAMLCLETANALSKAVHLPAGQAHTTAVTYSVAAQ